MGCLGNRESRSGQKEAEVAKEKKPEHRSLARERNTSDSESGELRIRAGQFVQKLTEPITNRYRIIKTLGSGNFGEVSLGEHKATHQQRAIKAIMKPKKLPPGQSQAKFITEVEILSHMDHPNIMKIYELYESREKYYIVSEVLSGGELFDYIISSKQLSEPIAARIMYQLFSAVNYCHQHQIVHRDLKPENLLLEAPPQRGEITIKVIDFGTSCLITGSEKLKQKLGTAYYIAPEVLKMNYNEKCDVWSCGVILYILLSGSPPFGGATDEEIISRVKTGRYDFPRGQWKGISEEAKSFIKSMLLMDYNRRPSAQECLDSPWIQKYRAQPTIHAEVITTSLNNLKSFNSEQKLRHAMMAFIAAQVVSKEQTKALTESFKALDINGDGRLSREELVAGYAKTMSMEEANEVVDQVMQSVDSDGSGFIDYSEFILASINNQTLLSKNNLEAAFQSIDKDHSGKLSIQELKDMLGSGMDDRDSVWKKLIEEADLDGDGEIDLAEFSRLMLQATSANLS